MQELESFLVLIQAEQALVFFIYEKLKELILPLVTKFMRTKLYKNIHLLNLFNLTLMKVLILLPSSFVHVGFAASGVLKKLGTLESTKKHQFKSSA